jgi:hypothetical protein
LFNIFVDDSISYISKNNQHTSVIGLTTIPEFIFADDLTFSSVTINGLQKAMVQVAKQCREWNLKCNLNKTKILVFKKGGKTEER